jgi:hypothetical protein
MTLRARIRWWWTLRLLRAEARVRAALYRPPAPPATLEAVRSRMTDAEREAIERRLDELENTAW